MASSRNKRRTMSEINVVPYIDVMLVLLVIFMITAPLLTQGVKIDLPKAHAKALSVKQTGPIIVTVDQTGQYYLNISNHPNAPLPAETLMTRVAAEVALDKQSNGQPRSVLVKGDQAVPYGKVVQAMVMLQNAGVDKVGLMTQEGDGH
ncbi:MAG: protein TolR [Gammaproteobacteria bacterium]|nr:protein TolR [Gammaproteobacteria bacterium]MBU1927208.1 protein TolR [Gammaproteobacteria bacterium]MBU2545666.1 protein TolR [Gammaproteobacteria bacterium]